VLKYVAPWLLTQVGVLPVASHINHKRGYAKLQPEEDEAARVLREFEAGVYGANKPPVQEEKPKGRPNVPPKPDELEEEIEKDKKRRGFFKLLGK
jgi:hypothetical protein